jgi:hypothetical protein
LPVSQGLETPGGLKVQVQDFSVRHFEMQPKSHAHQKNF